MPESDGYIPGVPCWVDVSEPDPAAAADFYGGLFGWEFEEVMPSGSAGSYLIARSRPFYESAFGWRTLAIGAGAQMWALPGYGDYLERYHPELRRRMAEAGAPAGFEDVVGSINPIPAHQPDTPAHWGVTFAVADADATAARATELGGTVIVTPFDAPWSTETYTIRITAIADPQGATFTASKFVPKGGVPGAA